MTSTDLHREARIVSLVVGEPLAPARETALAFLCPLCQRKLTRRGYIEGLVGSYKRCPKCEVVWSVLDEPDRERMTIVLYGARSSPRAPGRSRFPPSLA